MIKISDKNIYVRSKENCLILNLEENKMPTLAWYGRALNEGSDFAKLRAPGDAGHASTDDFDCKNRIISFTANGNDDYPFVILREKEGNFSHRFEYLGAEVMKSPNYLSGLPSARDKEQTLKLSYKAEGKEIYLNQFISTFSDCSNMTFSSEVINRESSPIYVRRLMSFQADFHAKQCEITTLKGAWARERKIQKTVISSGTFSNETKQGFSSNQANPYISVATDSGVLGLNLIWSGNHKEVVNIDEMQKLRVACGINDYCLDYEVLPNATFVAPEAVAVWGDSQTEVTNQMHKFTLAHVVTPKFALRERPILINNWEATYFDFDHDKLLNLAKLASNAGVELFVLDDGWFGKRDNDKSGLGDWVDNVKKTGGLANLRAEINALGLKFGLWVEPEMVNPDSDLYRAHPEYAMKVAGVEPITRRNQLILDLANPEVCEYIYQSISRVIKQVKPDYVKWDCNRYFIDVNSPSLSNQGNYYYDYLIGFYKILERLIAENDELLIEGCSSGGNRFDLGALYYTPQIWASDNTDASHRLFIQEGTFTAYPQNCAGCHVSISPNHQSQNSTSIETRFNVACFGAFGYEYDLTKCSEADLEAIKKQVEFYKEHRKLLQTGNMHLSGGYDQNKGVWSVVSEDKSRAIALIYRVHDRVNYPVETFKFEGLDKNALYRVSMREQNNCQNFESFLAYGDMLMTAGVNMGNIFYTEWDRKQNSNSIATRLVIFERV